MYLDDWTMGHVAVVSVVLRLRLDHLEGRRLESGGLLVRDGGELSVGGEVAVGGKHRLADVLVLPLALEELPRVLGGGSVVHADNRFTMKVSSSSLTPQSALPFPGKTSCFLWGRKREEKTIISRQVNRLSSQKRYMDNVGR